MSEQRVFANLEAMRGLAALFVCLSHAPWMSYAFAIPMVRHGWVFVDFFFVLSGFVIAYSYSERISNFAGILDFMTRRLYRLFPLHIFTLAASVALDIGRNFVLPALSHLAARGDMGGNYWRDVLFSLFLVHGMGVTEGSGPNSPSWSISTEVFAYLLFAGMAIIVPRSYRLVGFLLASLFGYIVLQCLQGWTGINGPLQFRFFRCIYAFSLGVVAFEVFSRVAGGTSIKLILAFQLLVWGVVFGLLLVMRRIDILSSILPMLFALAVLLAVLDRGSVLLRILDSRAGKELGELSYSLYMVHAFIASIIGFAVNMLSTGRSQIDDIIRPALPEGVGELLVLAYVAVTLVVSKYTFTLIEKPWRERGRVFGPKVAYWYSKRFSG